MPIRAFLSYSHKDRELARRLKNKLKEFGVEAFLAHDDIPVSERWRRAILKNLGDCELFINPDRGIYEIGVDRPGSRVRAREGKADCAAEG